MTRRMERMIQTAAGDSRSKIFVILSLTVCKSPIGFSPGSTITSNSVGSVGSGISSSGITSGSCAHSSFSFLRVCSRTSPVTSMSLKI